MISVSWSAWKPRMGFLTYYLLILGNKTLFYVERNWVFATNRSFLIPKSLQPDDANLSYFKLTLFDPPELIVWNINGLRHLVLKKLGFKNPSLWQKLNSFVSKIKTNLRSLLFAFIDFLFLMSNFLNNLRIFVCTYTWNMTTFVC